MPQLKCPVCGDALHRELRSLRCCRGHSYDIAKQNYVNLLMSNKSSSKRHGDDKLMVAARRDFLDGGHYAFMRAELCRLAVELCPERVDMLDAGCGEGYYSSAVKAALEAAGKSCSALGIDISKEALICAAKRDKSLDYAVAGINALPVTDASCDLILNIFAPEDAGEFGRVLRPGGLLMRVMPLETHLWGLKKAVYAKPYLNGPAEYCPEGFSIVCRSEPRAMIHLVPPDIERLFMMTPYYYKTGRDDQAKLSALQSLDTEAHFAVVVLRKD